MLHNSVYVLLFTFVSWMAKFTMQALIIHVVLVVKLLCLEAVTTVEIAFTTETSSSRVKKLSI